MKILAWLIGVITFTLLFWWLSKSAGINDRALVINTLPTTYSTTPPLPTINTWSFADGWVRVSVNSPYVVDAYIWARGGNGSSVRGGQWVRLYEGVNEYSITWWDWIQVKVVEAGLVVEVDRMGEVNES